MTDSEIVEQTIVFLKETLREAEGGHDWFHTQRVFNNAILIAKDEKANILVVSLGALLHDIADAKFHDGNETLGPQIAKDFLTSLEVDQMVVDHVVQIVAHSGYKNSLDKKKGDNMFSSMELKVVQDADRLDAIGAVGIARAFNYGGYMNRPLYDPSIPPQLHMDKDAYKKSNGPTINHFYEKLLLLKDQMNTRTGKALAEERHGFMLSFLEQFYKEWNGATS